VHTCRAFVLALSFLTFSEIAHAAARCDAAASPEAVSTQHALTADLTAGVIGDAQEGDRFALNEILLGSNMTRLRWDRLPELVVLMPVMQYEKGRGTEYRATADRLTDDEATQLVDDLTQALAVLTNDAVRGFSAVRRETAAPGEMVNVMRPGQIVVARYDGVRDQLATIGFGGRSTRGSTIRAGSIILDSDFDRLNDARRLLRMHELGHALGYNHVVSRASIMNPKIGSEPTDFDRAAARIAFDGFAAASACS
jgi:hypothetical protein